MSSQPHNYDALNELTMSSPTKRMGQGYTRLIKILRIALPLVAVGLIIVVMTWPDMERQVPLPTKEEIVPDAKMGMNELIKPLFQSTDKDKRPFTITAEKATQNQDNPELVMMESPEADLQLSDGGWVAARAKTALFEEKNEKLFLSGDVNLFHDSGYTLKSPELRINMKTGEAFSDRDVRVTGPKGTLNASGMEAFQRDEKIIFKGPATLVIFDPGLGLPHSEGAPSGDVQ
ncbi:MAG: LPS export ABC transporter periplasmic protein LptC [Alphaproteobacteria bacterium]|nr:LPS export ABC transporter periplasmic protein LptC [Alphaproteobacteria bacterium]